MAKTQQKHKSKFLDNKYVTSVKNFLLIFIPKSKWGRALAVTVYGGALLILLGMYIIARWYIVTNQDKPLSLGTTFVPNYARYLGVDPKKHTGR